MRIQSVSQIGWVVPPCLAALAAWPSAGTGRTNNTLQLAANQLQIFDTFNIVFFVFFFSFTCFITSNATFEGLKEQLKEKTIITEPHQTPSWGLTCVACVSFPSRWASAEKGVTVVITGASVTAGGCVTLALTWPEVQRNTEVTSAHMTHIWLDITTKWHVSGYHNTKDLDHGGAGAAAEHKHTH